MLSAALAVRANAADTATVSWLDNTISPVANPIFFEDPKVTSEVRPIYMYHFLPNTFDYSGGSVPLGGQVQVMAIQIRYALTDRLGLIASKQLLESYHTCDGIAGRIILAGIVLEQESAYN